jgi:glycosyltransferase involved in cell wall biosynthesis
MILGIDLTSPGSGGARRHITELLNRFNPQDHGFNKIIVWGGADLLSKLPKKYFIEKRSHKYLNRSLNYRIIWNLFFKDKQVTSSCDILFSPFGTYYNKSFPYVSMSRNMLLFDNTEIERFKFFSFIRLKLFLIRIQQSRSFKKASGIIFISEYAKSTILNKLRLNLLKTAIINHGVSSQFSQFPKLQLPITDYSDKKPFKLLYVSSVWHYKHQWNIVEAVSILREKGYPIILNLIGSNDNLDAELLLTTALKKCDPENKFVIWNKHIDASLVYKYYQNSDGFIFGSTCENMPNILIEAMSSGLPILCSNFLPMPEFLKDAGFYFDPLNINEIVSQIELFLQNHIMRDIKSQKSFSLSKLYSWEKCADETFSFLNNCIQVNSKNE